MTVDSGNENLPDALLEELTVPERIEALEEYRQRLRTDYGSVLNSAMTAMLKDETAKRLYNILYYTAEQNHSFIVERLHKSPVAALGVIDDRLGMAQIALERANDRR